MSWIMNHPQLGRSNAWAMVLYAPRRRCIPTTMRLMPDHVSSQRWTRASSGVRARISTAASAARSNRPRAFSSTSPRLRSRAGRGPRGGERLSHSVTRGRAAVCRLSHGPATSCPVRSLEVPGVVSSRAGSCRRGGLPDASRPPTRSRGRRSRSDGEIAQPGAMISGWNTKSPSRTTAYRPRRVSA